jgi:hypothetical protein
MNEQMNKLMNPLMNSSPEPEDARVHPCPEQHHLRIGNFLRIFNTVGSITTPQWKSSTPWDQSQPLNGNLQHRETNHNPSMEIFNTVGPITTPQWKSSTPWDQSQPLNGNLQQGLKVIRDQSQPLNGDLQHLATNHNPLIENFNTVRPITT